MVSFLFYRNSCIDVCQMLAVGIGIFDMSFTKVTNRQHSVHPLGSFAFSSATHVTDTVVCDSFETKLHHTKDRAKFSGVDLHHLMRTLALDRTWNVGTGQYACGTCKGACRARFTWSFEITNCEHGHVFNFNDVRNSALVLHAAQLSSGKTYAPV